MGNISVLWKKLTPEEKAPYLTPHDDISDTENARNTFNECSEDEASPRNKDDAGLRQTVSLKRASDRVQDFMDDWLKQVNLVIAQD